MANKTKSTFKATLPFGLHEEERKSTSAWPLPSNPADSQLDLLSEILHQLTVSPLSHFTAARSPPSEPSCCPRTWSWVGLHPVHSAATRGFHVDSMASNGLLHVMSKFHVLNSPPLMCCIDIPALDLLLNMTHFPQESPSVNSNMRICLFVLLINERQQQVRGLLITALKAIH